MAHALHRTRAHAITQLLSMGPRGRDQSVRHVFRVRTLATKTLHARTIKVAFSAPAMLDIKAMDSRAVQCVPVWNAAPMAAALSPMFANVPSVGLGKTAHATVAVTNTPHALRAVQDCAICAKTIRRDFTVKLAQLDTSETQVVGDCVARAHVTIMARAMHLASAHAIALPVGQSARRALPDSPATLRMEVYATPRAVAHPIDFYLRMRLGTLRHHRRRRVHGHRRRGTAVTQGEKLAVL
mmetsp:Transcript_24477/g.73282  ORF Transcript_24477/g.73282 Transcript_24477/m.73282 type:complete len:240 (+) Transcript_24477:7291-8010(+)